MLSIRGPVSSEKTCLVPIVTLILFMNVSIYLMSVKCLTCSGTGLGDSLTLRTSRLRRASGSLLRSRHPPDTHPTPALLPAPGRAAYGQWPHPMFPFYSSHSVQRGAHKCTQ